MKEKHTWLLVILLALCILGIFLLPRCFPKNPPIIIDTASPTITASKTAIPTSTSTSTPQATSTAIQTITATPLVIRPTETKTLTVSPDALEGMVNSSALWVRSAPKDINSLPVGDLSYGDTVSIIECVGGWAKVPAEQTNYYPWRYQEYGWVNGNYIGECK